MNPVESAYVRFTDSPSPFPSRNNSVANSENHEPYSEPPSPVLEEGYHQSQPSILARSFQYWRSLWQPRERFQSQYLTLIPLSDDRLKPRRTRLIVSILLLLAAAAVTAVFLLVPRTVSIGTITVHSTKMTFNSSTHTYRILLAASIPFQNANYAKVRVWGNVNVSFFDAAAGWTAVDGITVDKRTVKQVLEVKVDASNLPREYSRVVYTQCFNFPQKLIFFLLTTFKVSYMGYEYDLPDMDTYFMLDCSAASKRHDSNEAQGLTEPLPLSQEQWRYQQQQDQGQQQQQGQEQQYQQRQQHPEQQQPWPDWDEEQEGVLPGGPLQGQALVHQQQQIWQQQQ